jgi:hypothetical protein
MLRGDDLALTHRDGQGSGVKGRLTRVAQGNLSERRAV